MASSDQQESKPNKQVATNQAPAHGTQVKAGRFSLIWVVPLIALIIAGSLLWNSKLNNGPTITITTNSAQGIEEGKTLVKMRSVNVGIVKDVMVSPDYQHIELTVQMDKGTDDLLRSDTQFWVVKPRIENTGVSGLDTLLSGSYIELNMGAKSSYAKEFVALDEPPVRHSGERGLMLKLISSDSRKLGNGDVVTFRGFEVGAITETYLDVESQLIEYGVFIREPYAQLVTPNTAFWISSGVELNVSTSGLSFYSESLDNLIVGGVSFDNFIPANAEVPVQEVADGATYTLYPKREEARLASLEGSLLYVVMLEDSIYALTPGAAVMFRGVKVGEVVKVPWFEDQSEVFTSHVLPVLIAIDRTTENQELIESSLNTMLKEQGLCAQVGSANMIFSNNMIELKHDPNHKCALRADVIAQSSSSLGADGVMAYRNYNVIPLIPMQSLSTQIDAFIAKLNELDLAGLSTDLQESLRAITAAMNAFTVTNNMMDRTQVIAKLAEAFDNFNDTVKGYGPSTPLYEGILQNLKNIEQLLQDIAPAASEVGQDPTSLIFGAGADPIPQAPRPNRQE
ncbi:MAG: MlaD family protein [Anaerobiospirillum sp.]|nr:MlaD family protein [Anaerobiospirillum sp.]